MPTPQHYFQKKQPVPKPYLSKSFYNDDVVLNFYTPHGDKAVFDLRCIFGILPSRVCRVEISDGKHYVMLMTNTGPVPTGHTVEELTNVLYPYEVEL